MARDRKDNQVREGYFDSGGLKIHYRVQGHGEPVILLHGLTMDANSQWAAPGIEQRLAKTHQVISFDARGHGKSDKPTDPNKYGTKMGEDVLRLLDHLNIEKAHVVGYSMGARVALKIASTHPDRVQSMVLGGAGWTEEANPKIWSDIADSLERGKGLRPLIDLLTPLDAKRRNDQEVDDFNRIILARNNPRVLAAVVRGFTQLHVSEKNLAGIVIPTLSVTGDNDPLKREADNFRGRLPNLEMEQIRDANHMSTFASPRFADSIIEFLGKHSSCSSNVAPSSSLRGERVKAWNAHFSFVPNAGPLSYPYTMEQDSSVAGILRKVLLGRAARNPRYSLRAYARDLGVSHSHLSRVLTGQRRLSPKQASRFAVRLRLESGSHSEWIRAVFESWIKGKPPASGNDGSA